MVNNQLLRPYLSWVPEPWGSRLTSHEDVSFPFLPSQQRILDAAIQLGFYLGFR